MEITYYLQVYQDIFFLVAIINIILWFFYIKTNGQRYLMIALMCLLCGVLGILKDVSAKAETLSQHKLLLADKIQFEDRLLDEHNLHQFTYKETLIVDNYTYEIFVQVQKNNTVISIVSICPKPHISNSGGFFSGKLIDYNFCKNN